MHLIVDWLYQALGNWQGWLSGGGTGGLIVIAVGLVERFTEWKMPKRWYATLVFAGFFCGANFVAWSSAFQSMKGREGDLHKAEIRELTAETKNVVLQARIDGLEKLQPVEAATSLRRKAKKLADDIDAYVTDRELHHPVPVGSDQPGATPEEKAQHAILTSYGIETINTCLKRFGPSWREIVQQLSGRGIPTHAGQYMDLVWSFREDQPYPQCADAQQTELLRDLAYRLDAQGNPIHF